MRQPKGRLRPLVRTLQVRWTSRRSPGVAGGRPVLRLLAKAAKPRRGRGRLGFQSRTPPGGCNLRRYLGEDNGTCVAGLGEASPSCAAAVLAGFVGFRKQQLRGVPATARQPLSGCALPGGRKRFGSCILGQHRTAAARAPKHSSVGASSSSQLAHAANARAESLSRRWRCCGGMVQWFRERSAGLCGCACNGDFDGLCSCAH